MKRIFILVSAICFNFFAAPTLAQNLYKCEDAQGKLEYRNAPCDAAQKNAGSVKGGSVTTMKSSDTASASSAANKAGNAGNVSNAASAPNSLQEKAAALMKSLKGQAAPIDTTEIALCRSQGKHWVEGMGCINEAPHNKNPAISSGKMQEICSKTGRKYSSAFNECY